MNFFNFSTKGIMGLLAGQAAARETAKLFHTLKNVGIAVGIFLGFLVLSLILLDIVLILHIIGWFR